MSKIDVKLLKVDPSLWPEEATHYNLDNNMFYKVEDGEVYCRSRGDWHVSDHSTDSFVNCSDTIPHPTKQELDGGLPPVGCECEYQLKHDATHEWSSCVIEFIGDRHIVAKCWPDETMPEFEQCFKKREVKFRPLKSQQDRLREELIKVIDDCDDMAYSFRPDDIADAILSRYSLEPKP